VEVNQSEKCEGPGGGDRRGALCTGFTLVLLISNNSFKHNPPLGSYNNKTHQFNLCFKCMVKSQGLGIPKIRGLWWGGQVWPCSLTNVPHPWSLSVVKHKANLIMKLDICRSGGLGEGGFLHLLLKNGRQLIPMSLWCLHVGVSSLPLTLKE
jgi:hypothetical protein